MPWQGNDIPRTGAVAAVMMVASIITVLAWGVLAFGANYPWAYLPLMAAAAVVGGAAMLRAREKVNLPWALVGAIGLLVCAILLQLLPLRAAWLSAISPATHALLQEQNLIYAVSGEAARHPLSIHPKATWTALGFLVSYSLLMMGVAGMLTRSMLRTLSGAIVGLGVLVALIGIIQMPTFDGRIYGFWEPLARNTSFGPFVNHNHFAGWMLMVIPLAVTFAIGQTIRGLRRAGPSRRDRWLWWGTPDGSRSLMSVLAAALMVVTLPLTFSRSGMISACVAAALIGTNLLRRGRAGSAERRFVWLLGGGAVVLALWAAPAVMPHFLDPGMTTFGGRTAIWRDTLAIVKDFALTGTGLNTYGVASLSYQTTTALGHAREAHSDYLQLAAEGGVLLGVPILLVVVAFVREARRRFRAEPEGSSYWLRFGACCGLIAIAVQSLVEFSLQMPGNAALFAVLAGIAIAPLPIEPRKAGLDADRPI